VFVDFASRSPRIRADIPVAVASARAPGDLDRPAAGHVRDLHMDGIGLSHDGLDVQVGDVVCVQFPPVLPHGLSVPGRVMWKDRWGLGLKVEGLGPGAKSRYQKLVTSLLSSSPVTF
jgi:hypothetical protein